MQDHDGFETLSLKKLHPSDHLGHALMNTTVKLLLVVVLSMFAFYFAETSSRVPFLRVPISPVWLLYSGWTTKEADSTPYKINLLGHFSNAPQPPDWFYNGEPTYQPQARKWA